MNGFSACKQEVIALHLVSCEFVVQNSAVLRPVGVAFAFVKLNYYKFER